MIKYFLVSLCAVFALASCTVYEDYTFAKDGSVKYKMTVDMNEMVKQTGQSPLANKGPGETSFNLSQLLNDSLPPHLQEKYKDFITSMKPFDFEISENNGEKENIIYIMADFKSADDLNTGLQAFQNITSISGEITKDMKRYEREKAGIEQGADEGTPDEVPFKLGVASTIAWNGKQMSQVFQKTGEVTKEEEEEVVQDKEESADTSMMGMMGKAVQNSMEDVINQMLGFGSYTVRYHFADKIKFHNHKNAKLSDDEKSLEISFEGLKFLSETDRDIVIETK